MLNTGQHAEVSWSFVFRASLSFSNFSIRASHTVTSHAMLRYSDPSSLVTVQLQSPTEVLDKDRIVSLGKKMRRRIKLMNITGKNE